MPMSMVLIAMFCTGIGLVIVGSMQFYMILGEVNARLEPKNRIGPAFVNYRLFEILRRHRAFYPDSKARIIMFGAICLGILLFLSAFVGGIIRQSSF